VKRDEELFRYQSNAANPEAEEPSAAEQEEAERVRVQIQEVLAMPGYAYLHQLFMQYVEHAQNMLSDLRTPAEQLRFYQGVSYGISQVQHAFVRAGKPKEVEESENGQ
jgi:hypothetical protein